MKLRLLVGTVAAVVLCATTASAQVCQGDLPFRGSSNHVGGAIGISDNATAFGGGLSHGHQAGWFGGASVGMVSYDGIDSHSAVVNGGLGYSMPVQKGSKLQVCPGGTLSLGFGPNVGGAKNSSQTVTLGASFGTSLPLTRTSNLIPFGSVAFAHTRISSDALPDALTDNYVLLGAGAGWQFTPRLVLRPAISIAAGADAIDDTSFSFGITWALPH